MRARQVWPPQGTASNRLTCGLADLSRFTQPGHETRRPHLPWVGLGITFNPVGASSLMLTCCHIDVQALSHNIAVLRSLLGARALLAPNVKGNAYGHGLVLASRAFLAAGADWLCVNAIYEAQALRDAGIDAPIYVVGYTGRHELAQAISLGCRMVLYNVETYEAAAAIAKDLNAVARFHLKLETGNHRQGLDADAALALARRVHADPHTQLEGVASHFANIEDTTDHNYAREQLTRFEAFCARLQAERIDAPLRHLSNSAAAILWPTRFHDMARVGIAAYGMWPSKETLVASLLSGPGALTLRPALRWSCRIAQVKSVPAGAYVGYGCTYRTTHPTRLAILPVGYYDGYDRKLSNVAHVLIDGQRAPVRGRVCMNITMVDVTDIPTARLEGDAVLLGRSGDEEITAEQFADWAGSINYEVTTRINDRIPRLTL